MFFKKKTVTLNIAVGQQFTTCDLQMNSWSWEEKDLFLFGFFFFFFALHVILENTSNISLFLLSCPFLWVFFFFFGCALVCRILVP